MAPKVGMYHTREVSDHNVTHTRLNEGGGAWRTGNSTFGGIEDDFVQAVHVRFFEILF
jgi:uncharacterized protein YaaQ